VDTTLQEIDAARRTADYLVKNVQISLVHLGNADMMDAGWGARLRQWARLIKRDVATLWIAARDSRTPLAAKLVAAAIAAYALSPIDLIPDFIPVLGYLDDLIVVPLGIMLAVRIIPSDLLAEFRTRALEMASRPASRIGLAIVFAFWIAGAGVLFWWAWLRAA